MRLWRGGYAPEVEGVGGVPALLVHHELHTAGEVGRKEAQGEETSCWLACFCWRCLERASHKQSLAAESPCMATIWPRSVKIHAMASVL